ncbi:MAG: transposase [Nitrospirota bacterium]
MRCQPYGAGEFSHPTRLADPTRAQTLGTATARSVTRLTTREIHWYLEELYEVEISPTPIPTIIDAVLEDVRIWQSRPLDAMYPILFFVCL